MDRVQLSHQYEARLGCPPLIRINGKAPLDQQWSAGPRRDPDLWRARLQDHAGNVGLLTGAGLFVVDVDLYVDGAEDTLDDLFDMELQADLDGSYRPWRPPPLLLEFGTGRVTTARRICRH